MKTKENYLCLSTAVSVRILKTKVEHGLILWTKNTLKAARALEKKKIEDQKSY